MNDDVRALWREQQTEGFRRRIEEMEKRSRRYEFDVYLAFTLCAAVMIGLAMFAPNFWIISGAILSTAGFAFAVREVHRVHAQTRVSAEDGAAPSIDFHRAFLTRQLAAAEKGVWLRVFALAPGPLLFSIGFAIAFPQAANIIYFQMATFVLVLCTFAPLNRRKRATLRRQLEELDRVTPDGR